MSIPVQPKLDVSLDWVRKFLTRGRCGFFRHGRVDEKFSAERLSVQKYIKTSFERATPAPQQHVRIASSFKCSRCDKTSTSVKRTWLCQYCDYILCNTCQGGSSAVSEHMKDEHGEIGRAIRCSGAKRDGGIMNPATYEYTAASIQSLQPGIATWGVRTMMRADAPDRGVPGFFLCPGFQQGALVTSISDSFARRRHCWMERVE